MDGPSGTPPTPPYSVPAPGAHSPPQMAANPSTVAAGAASTARVLFVPPRANAGAAQKAAPAGAGSKRPAGAAAAGGQPATKKAPKKVSARKPGGRASSSAVADFLAPPTSSARAPPARATSTAAAAAGARQVLDDMATSVDNESFLEAMNVGSSFADNQYQQGEEEQQVHQMDEHGEGLIEPPKMGMGRAGNYTLDEDRLLCKTWLKIGMDPAVGTDQTRDTYWVRMKDYFDANNTTVQESNEEEDDDNENDEDDDIEDDGKKIDEQ